MTETVKVACPGCGHRFAASLQVDRASLEAMVLAETYTCPRCGAVSTYHKEDHFFELETEPPPKEQGPSDGR